MWAIQVGLGKKPRCFLTGELHTSEGSAINRAKELTIKWGNVYTAVEVTQEQADMIRLVEPEELQS